MKNHIKSHVKKYSLIAFTSLLTIGSTVALAQSDASQQLNEKQKNVSVLTQTEKQSSIIHLNDSSVEQLQTLKGVGQKRAHAIIVYREQVGKFKSVEEITKVKGIGDKIISDNKLRLQI